ncbi:unnamed protein product [Mytilus edulis]|uniref:Uncharacterized protein n=1 Tax=Mytilus edulis TaxID=6550 RepID=A0A8S3QT44_MYTED|nr:unnamed protein product [Mytilus edulis]
MNISSPIKSQKLRLWLSFVAGVLANMLLGPSDIFYVYANEVQVIFNINKKQGLSDSIQIIISQKIVAKNFSSAYRGIIMAIMGESISIGMLLFSVVYYIIPLKNHRFQQLMIFLFFFSVFVYIFCFLFLREVHLETDYTNILPDDTHDPILMSEEVHPTDVILKKTFLQIVKDPNYQLLAWLSTLAFATGSVLKNNLTVLSQVSGLSNFDSKMVIYGPVFSSIGGIVIGLLSDKLRQSLTRLPFLLLSCLLQTLCSFINMFFVQNLAFIVLSVVLTGLSLGSLYVLVSSIVSEMFHIDNYNRNYGIIKGGHAVATLLLQYIFGAFYDDNVSDSKLFCRGLHCTETGYTMNTIVSLIPVLLCVILLKRNALKLTN